MFAPAAGVVAFSALKKLDGGQTSNFIRQFIPNKMDDSDLSFEKFSDPFFKMNLKNLLRSHSFL